MPSQDTPYSLSFPSTLPINSERERITTALKQHQVLIIAGETGSGKTTQLPKICLSLGRQSIAHTQPRRLAARTVAERIAEEIGQKVGETVGYQIRFTERISQHTRIKIMTDGILLNELHHDRLLKRYDTIIIDEAHERSLNIDFLLGYLKTLLPRRKDLKVIITSATIDPEGFANHFCTLDGKPAPILHVSGRTFPVDIRYRPLTHTDQNTSGTDTPPSDENTRLQGVKQALNELERETAGDVLIFFATESEIRDAKDFLQGSLPATTELLPLYGRLSSKQQHLVFESSRQPNIRKRIILATNIAETSLTVPGIRYVIDTGTARISKYNTRAKIQRLPIQPISQASANQRSGRSGRTSEGIAIRLYSEEDFLTRAAFTDPEIMRTNLASVLLRMVSLKLGNIDDFPFLTKPDSRGVKDGLELLSELGALTPSSPPQNSTPQLSQIGHSLARLPIEPRFARMVVESEKYSLTHEILVIVSGLTVQDVREYPSETREQARQQHARFTDPTSDFLSLLNLWNYLEEQNKALSSNAFRRLCIKEYINFLRVREWQDLYRQLTSLLRQSKITITPKNDESAANPDFIHRCLLSGLLSHIGIKSPTKTSQNPKRTSGKKSSPVHEYLGARGRKFIIFPGSSLAKKPPEALMSAEIIETSKIFARMNARINPAWAESLAPDLCIKNYSEPHWEKKQGQAVAYEKVLLYGIPIVPKRRVSYTRINPEHSRDLCIRHGLIENQWLKTYPFQKANAHTLEQLHETHHRLRSHFDYEDALTTFYDQRIPTHVVSASTFDKWWEKQKHKTPLLLNVTHVDLLGSELQTDQNEFPSHWESGTHTFPITYVFAPGATTDGATIRIPLSVLPSLSTEQFTWFIPGMRIELITALLRSLPKPLRRAVVPTTNWAQKLSAHLENLPQQTKTHKSLPAVLAEHLEELTHCGVRENDFDATKLSSHLSFTFEIVDSSGIPLDQSQDLNMLQTKWSQKAHISVSYQAQKAFADQPVRTWDFDDLNTNLTLETPQSSGNVQAYPCLVDQKDHVLLTTVATLDERNRMFPKGLRRMLYFDTPSPASYIVEHLTGIEKMFLATSPYPSLEALFEDMVLAAIDLELYKQHPDRLIFNRASYETVLHNISSTLVDKLFLGAKHAASALQASGDVAHTLTTLNATSFLEAKADIQQQMSALLCENFISTAGLNQLVHFERYFKAINIRIDSLTRNPGKEEGFRAQVHKATDLFFQHGGSLPLPNDTPVVLHQARWMLEELRVSLFAQSLPTAQKISLQRINTFFSNHQP